MTRLLILASMLFASAVFAQVEIPHVHKNGDVIDANEINKNLDIVANAVPPRDCSTNQLIKWDGSAWVCSSLTLVSEQLSGQGGIIRCPSGTKVTGGGCEITGRKCDDTFSTPEDDLSGWGCAAVTTGDEYCEVRQGYAICQ